MAHAADGPTPPPFVLSTDELLQQFDESQRLAGLGSWSWDLVTGTVAFSRETYRIMRVPPDVSPDFNLVLDRAVDPAHRQEFLDRVAAALRGEREYDFEIAARVAPDEIIVLHTRGAVFRDEHGQPVRMAGTVQDVTAMRQAEAERERLQAQLEQARRVESLGLLAGGIAHDFNNLLVGILTNASEAVRELQGNAPVREMLEDIVRAARHAGDLTRQLLAYAGHTHLERERVRLAPLVEELPALLGARIPPEVRVVFEAIGDPVVRADVTQLRQVVMNLLTNAVDAGSGAREIHVRVAEEMIDASLLAASVLGDERRPGRYATISVRDTGVGIPPEVQQRIFDPFFTTKGSSRGLGLATTRGVLQAHEAAIHVQSAPGEGTTIRVMIPPDAPVAATPAAHPAPAATHGARVIILVDDDAPVRRAALRILLRAGYTVHEAGSGEEALQLAQSLGAAADLMILDLAMPGMGGLECLQQLRAAGHRLPVVIVSGFDSDGEAARLARRGEVALLRKPYEAEELLTQVRMALS